MSTVDDTQAGSKKPSNELSPEEAQSKRKYHLELAQENARRANEQNNASEDTGEATLATFILPGD